MAMQQQFQRSLKSIFILSLIAIISACGGGSDNKKPPIPSDVTPNAFSFIAVTGAAVSSEVTSPTVTISGIDTASTISITGGTYAIGTGAFTSTAGTITTGQTVKVKVMTSASNSTAVTATLTIGGVTGSFSVTTIAADATPNAFELPAATGVQPNSVNTSAVVTVAGINVAVPISITGGEYSINGGTYTSVAGTVSAAQTVTVRTTAAAAPSAAVDAVLTIGGVSATYTVTTIADVLAPTAQILFPPPVSMTEGNTILVRGTASDAYSIKSVKVNGVTATTADGFANWQALVPLTDTTTLVTATTENTITVVTEDDAGNIATDAAHVAITQAPITSAFPVINGGNEFNTAWGLALDQLGGRNRLLVTDDSSNITSIDLTNGKRSVFATTSCNTLGIAINSIYKHVYASCYDQIIDIDIDLADSSQMHVHSNVLYKSISSLIVDIKNEIVKIISINDLDGAVIATNQAFDNFSVLSDAKKSIPNAANPINNSYSIVQDKAANRYLVSDYSQQAILSIDASTGVRSVFSNSSTGTGDLFGVVDDKYVSAIGFDEHNQRALVTETFSGKIFAIDLATGNRSLLSSVTSDNPYNVVNNSYGVAIADANGYAFFSDADLGAILAVDLVTGHRVVFSK